MLSKETKVQIFSTTVFYSFMLGAVGSVLMAAWADRHGAPVLPFALVNTSLAAFALFMVRAVRGRLYDQVSLVFVLAAVGAWMSWAKARWLPVAPGEPFEGSLIYDAGRVAMVVVLAAGCVCFYAAWIKGKARADGGSSS